MAVRTANIMAARGPLTILIPVVCILTILQLLRMRFELR